MAHRLKPPSLYPPSARDVIAGLLRMAVRSPILRALLFALTLYGVWLYSKPWDLGWLRPDEAEDLAESFLAEQGVELGDFTLIQAVERRREGTWAARSDEKLRFGADPAVGYLQRYFRPGHYDGWSVAVSPSGQVYRVQREQLEDEPGQRLSRGEALHTVVVKLAEELAIPAYALTLVSDTLIFQPQRTDWVFTFNWPEALGIGGTFRVTLAGDAIAQLEMQPAPRPIETVPRRSPKSSRVLGFALILGGVFLMMHYHRTPLALRTAGIWGGIVFALTLLSRGLTFPQAVILMPADVSMTGYLARIGLSALITAIQAGLIVGLVVATGEALARDVFRRAITLSRIAPGLYGWRSAWARGARWAFPAAALVLVYEAIACHYFGPVGLCSKVPGMVANMLSSPLPGFALPVELLLDVIMEETVYRLWLLALFLFWLRLPVLAVPLAAAAAAFFAGFDLAQLTTVGGLFYLAWGVVAGTLMVRSGIVAAMLFHLLVIAGYTSLVLIWMGFGLLFGAGLLAGMLMLILIIAREKQPTPSPQLDILGPVA